MSKRRRLHKQKKDAEREKEDAIKKLEVEHTEKLQASEKQLAVAKKLAETASKSMAKSPRKGKN